MGYRKMKAKWSIRAKHDYFEVLDYLLKDWGVKEVETFINITDDVVKKIEKKPRLFVESTIRKNIHKGFLTKHNSLFYKVFPRKNEILILTIWDNRKDPKKRSY